jgi:LCP family protein required for cell wall assembly
LGAIAGFLYLQRIDARLKDGMRDVDPEVGQILDEQQVKGGDFNMIIMGTDNREGETAARSDTLIVARIDPQQQTATLLSIPRDSRVEVPGYGTTKINAAAFRGGPSLVIETVTEFTGLPISHYIEMDFNGFRELVDALGGVTIDVPQTIIDPKAGDYDPDVYKIYEGQQVLNGGQALTFVRSRNFPEGDIARIRNQQIFIKSLLREALQLSSVFRINSLVEATVSNVTTDMTLTELLALANSMKGMSDGALETVTMPGTPQYIGGVSYVVPDEDALAEMIERMEKGLTAIAGPTEVPEIDPSDITVDVRNGAGLAGVAGDASSKIEAGGFTLGDVGNANQFVYDRTLIVHDGNVEAADLVRESLGMGDVISSRGMYVFSTDVLVVVGKDWGPVETN